MCTTQSLRFIQNFVVPLFLRECVFHYCEMNQAKENKAQEVLLSFSLWKVLEQVRSYVSFFISCILLPGKMVWNQAQALKRKKTRPKLDSLEQKEVVRSHFVPPQIGSTY